MQMNEFLEFGPKISNPLLLLSTKSMVVRLVVLRSVLSLYQIPYFQAETFLLVKHQRLPAWWYVAKAELPRQVLTQAVCQIHQHKQVPSRSNILYTQAYTYT